MPTTLKLLALVALVAFTACSDTTAPLQTKPDCTRGPTFVKLTCAAAKP